MTDEELVKDAYWELKKKTPKKQLLLEQLNPHPPTNFNSFPFSVIITE